MLALLLLPLYDVPQPASADTTQARWLADLDPATGQARKRKAKGPSWPTTASSRIARKRWRV